MSSPPLPFDPGLQPERTVLAWRRTALSIVVGSVVGARLLASAFGATAIAVGGAGLVLGLVLTVAATRRGQRIDASLREHGDLSHAPGAAALAVIAASCCLGATTVLALMVSGALT